MLHRSDRARGSLVLSTLALLGIAADAPTARAQQPAPVAPSARAPIGGVLYSPRLGISYQLVPYGNAFGAVLTQNAPYSSPLGRPQIQLEGGDMITHLDGVPIAHAGELENHHSQTSVTFVNIRTGFPQTSIAYLPPMGPPVPGPGPIPNPNPGGPYVLGVNAVPVTVNLGGAAASAPAPSPYPYPIPGPGGTRGLRVVSITPGGAAEIAGVRAGDTLLTAGRFATTDLQALRRAIGQSGGVLPLTVVDPYGNTRSTTAYLGGGTMAAPAP